MTDILHRSRTALRPRFRIRTVADRRALDAAMAEDRPYAAYALAHLEHGLFEHARFWVADGLEGHGVVMHAGGMLGPALCTMGDAAAVDALLSLHPGPLTSYLATGAPEHMAALDRTYAISSAVQMQRMSVSAASFEAVPGAVRRLQGPDARALNMLYSTEGSPTGYRPDHIERGVYFGAYEGNRLLAVAGTHVVAPNVGIAVVGNVFTHPEARGGGLATRVTSAVTAELLDRGCALVALTVNPTNTPALRAYQRLGYTLGSNVVEARLRRGDMTGITSALRRFVARRSARGGEPGDEIAPGHAPDRKDRR